MLEVSQATGSARELKTEVHIQPETDYDLTKKKNWSPDNLTSCLACKQWGVEYKHGIMGCRSGVEAIKKGSQEQTRALCAGRAGFMSSEEGTEVSNSPTRLPPISPQALQPEKTCCGTLFLAKWNVGTQTMADFQNKGSQSQIVAHVCRRGFKELHMLTHNTLSAPRSPCSNEAGVSKIESPWTTTRAE